MTQLCGRCGRPIVWLGLAAHLLFQSFGNTAPRDHSGASHLMVGAITLGDAIDASLLPLGCTWCVPARGC